MTRYEVAGDSFRSTSSVIRKTKPPFFEEADTDSEFGVDFGITPDYANDQFDVDGGYARMYDGSAAWHGFYEATNTLTLEAPSGVNYLYAVYDNTQNSLEYEVLSSDSPTGSITVKLAEIDAGAQEVTKVNTDPNVSVPSQGFRDSSGVRQQTIQYDEELRSLVVIKE